MELWILLLTINVLFLTFTVGKVSKQLDELKKEVIG
jgi:hypothetical protein